MGKSEIRNPKPATNPKSEALTGAAAQKAAAGARDSVFVGLLCVFLLSGFGCVSHRQYRTDLTASQGSLRQAPNESAAIEDYGNYLIGFVEFDDQGWLWSRDQLNAVMKRLAEEEQKQRLLIITYVHGWKHNARTDDSNVKMLRDTLRLLSRLEQMTSKREGRAPRKVMGVYAGWRGLSVDVWGLNNLTFWERKNTAHEVGRGALCELFVRLEEFRDASHFAHAGQKEQTRLILIGHSFGGAATYSALASILAQRAIQTTDDHGTNHPPRGVGDLVMLVNPAFEASRFGVLHDIATNETYQTSNLVNLAIFTSKGDDATKMAFPLGRHVSTLFDKYQSSLERKANCTAVGHFGPYITHDLIATPRSATNQVSASESTNSSPVMSPQEMDQASDRITQLKAQTRTNVRKRHGATEDFTYHFVGSDLRPRPGRDPRMPLYVVSVDTKIIPDHNGIARPAFLRFLGQFITTFEPEQ